MESQRTLLKCGKIWKKIKFSSFLFLISFSAVQSQNYTPFLQGQAAYLYYNPAFAGSTGFHRIGLGYHEADQKLQRLYVSYDQYFSKAKCGFGILATNIPVYFGGTNQKISYTFMEISASPKVRISKRLMLSSGVSISVGSNTYVKSKAASFINNKIPSNLNVNYSAGLVLNSKSFYAAYCIRKYEPLLSTFDTIIDKFDVRELPTLFSTIQIGMIFKTNKSFNVVPSLIYQMYHNPDMRRQNDLTLFANFKYKKFFWAIGVGGSNMQASLGYYGDRYRIGISKGLNYHNLLSEQGYLFASYELFLSYTFEDFSNDLFKLLPHSSEKEEVK